MEDYTNYPIPSQELSIEDREILRLKTENENKQISFDKQREIQMLREQSKRIDMQKRAMNKASNPIFNFTKEKVKFYTIALVVSITVAIVLVKIAQKLF